MARRLPRRELLRGSAALALAVLACRLRAPGDAGPSPAREAAETLPPLSADAVPVRRRILALYSSLQAREVATSEVHRNAEVVLNHLGLVVDYHDIAGGLPADEVMGAYRGLITWFAGPAVRDAGAYLRWLTAQLEVGRRLVVFGDLGAYRDAGGPAPAEEVDAFFRELGAEYRGGWTDERGAFEVAAADASNVEFERKLRADELLEYRRITAADPAARVYLRLRLIDQPESVSDAVFTTKRGGFALPGCAVYTSPQTGLRQWRLDPFRFFVEAFDLAGLPRPDVTTLSGSRVFYTHFDGDGFGNISEVDRHSISAEIVLRELIDRYRLPFTASAIVVDLEPSRGGSPAARRIASEIFRRPNVEVASHTYTHPFVWTGRTLVRREGEPTPKAGESIREQPIDLVQEIDESIEYLNRLAPAGKRVALLLWSGDTRPPEEALARLARLGVGNLNGGDSRFDGTIDSLTGLAPLTRQVGAYHQVYSSNANDNIYSDGWTGPFDGLRNVITTFERTDAPRRLSPMNVYFHLFSGQKAASLAALRNVYDWALSRPIAPVFASEYVALVEGFLAAEISRQGDAWIVRNAGALRTLRWDGELRFPDLDRSTNVIGFWREREALYVHLGPAPESRVVLTAMSPNRPYLARASHQVVSWQAGPDEAAVALRGIGPKHLTLGGLWPDRPYRVEIGDERGQTTREATADREGRLAVDWPADGVVRFRVVTSGR